MKPLEQQVYGLVPPFVKLAWDRFPCKKVLVYEKKIWHS
jgi:hypothetical protein